jgi:D-alanine-D-alanine ligase
MDKHRSKAVLRDIGINVPDGFLVSRTDAAKAHAMEMPYVLKPNGQGSSVGVFIVKEGQEELPDIADSAAMGEQIICERFTPGRELTVTVMDGRALSVTEIVPRNAFYDFDAKYADGGSIHVCPAKISDEIRDLCLTWASLAHDALGCRGITRSDFIYSDINDDLMDNVKKVVMLEVNTQPGMTPTSLVPEQAALAGMNFGQLCRWIVEDASWPR